MSVSFLTKVQMYRCDSQYYASQKPMTFDLFSRVFLFHRVCCMIVAADQQNPISVQWCAGIYNVYDYQHSCQRQFGLPHMSKNSSTCGYSSKSISWCLSTNTVNVNLNVFCKHPYANITRARNHRHKHTRVRTHARTHTHTKQTNKHTHTHARAHTQTHTHTHTHWHTHTCHVKDVNKLMNWIELNWTHARTRTHTHTRTHRHTHTHTNARPHARTHTALSWPTNWKSHT
jgi:hypothetical protein